MDILERDTWLSVIRAMPRTAATIVGRLLAVELPQYTNAVMCSPEALDGMPPEYRPDCTVLLADNDGAPVHAIAIKVQLPSDERVNDGWPACLTWTRERLELPTMLLVISPDQGLVEWCQQPIAVNPTFVLRPLVIGTDDIPLVTASDEAEHSPDLAILSAMAHGNDPEHGERVRFALSAAVAKVDDETANLCREIVSAASSEQHLQPM